MKHIEISENGENQIHQVSQLSNQTLDHISSKYMIGFNVDDKNGKIDDERIDVKSVVTVFKKSSTMANELNSNKLGHILLLCSTIHGVSNAARTQRLSLRILWLSMILLATGFCIFTVYNSTGNYLDFEVFTKTKKVEEETVIFPSFIICARVEDNLKSLNAIDRCKFNNIDCSKPTDFELFSSDRQIGNHFYDCLRYNGFQRDVHSVFKSIRSVADDQLKIRLAEGGPDGFRFSEARLLITVQDNYLNTLEYSKSYWIEQGDYFNVYVTKMVDNKLGKPHNKCQKMDVSYRQLNCIEKCQHESVGIKYNCSLPGYYQLKEYGDLCANITAKKKQFREKCEKTCPEECDMTEYSVTILQGRLKDNETGALTVYAAFQSMRHIRITQVAKTTVWDLMSSLGGTLGFLGMSFLTFVEIFELVIELVLERF